MERKSRNRKERIAVKKPKEISLYDGLASCESESMVFETAFGVQVEGFLYTAKDVRRLIKFLSRAEKWIANKELYRGHGVK